MPILKNSEVKKMNDKEIADKLQDLKLELVRANVTANKPRAKTKELKRAISRILTMINSQKQSKSQSKLGSFQKKELKK